MGQGQSEAANLKFLEMASIGGWLLLQHVHLSISWLEGLIDLISNTKEIHPNFRLFLTLEPHLRCPSALIQRCIKVTMEAPIGIFLFILTSTLLLFKFHFNLTYIIQFGITILGLKANIRRTFNGWSPEIFNRGPWIRSQGYFLLSWFHAIIQERRRYIPQGWNSFHDFSEADLRSVADQIDVRLLKFFFWFFIFLMHQWYSIQISI